MELISRLKEEFPRDVVSWRSQSITRDGTKALALAYIDARDVMRRLDDVLGAENWMDSYVETIKGRVICTLSLRLNGEWVSKADGAGNTDVEADKGGISDAFKRAAVKWGVGRYLYDTPSVWVPCKTYVNAGGKTVFDSFTADPWSFVKKPAYAPPAASIAFEKPEEREKFYEDTLTAIEHADAAEALTAIAEACKHRFQLMGASPAADDQEALSSLRKRYSEKLATLKKPSRTTVDNIGSAA